MRTLSVDPGFKRMGWALFEGNELEEFGVSYFRERNSDESFFEYRNSGIVAHLNFFSSKTRLVNQFIVETQPPFNITVQRLLSTVALATLYMVCYDTKAAWNEVSASTVKKHITGNAKASKAKMRQAIVKLYPQVKTTQRITDIPFDLIDAIAIGKTWLDE